MIATTRRLPALAAAFVATLLASCVPPGEASLELRPSTNPTPQTGVEYRLASGQYAWSAQPGALLVLNRYVPQGHQQIIALANDTVEKGDNYLALIAYGSADKVPKRFDLATVMSRVEGVPQPFGSLSDSDLLQRRDALGTYLVAEKSVGRGATCVLALRRLSFASRMLPAGTAAMEVILRNCATGSAQAALAPLRPERLALSLGAAPPDAGPGSRVLNPLAAPEQ